MTPAAKKIKDRIQQTGPVTWREFMEMALYDPDDGYYTRHCEIGPRGDYYSSSNVHAVFGELLAHKFAALLAGLDEAIDLTLVEVGGGSGQLAADILACLHDHYPHLCERVTYVLSELSPSLRQAQQHRLQDDANVVWCNLEEIPRASVRGIIFSNELIDALPVHRLIQQGGELRELLVDWRDGHFFERPGEVKLDELKRFIATWEVNLSEGQVVEVNLSAIDYLRRVAALFVEGYLVTLDYGELRPRLYAPSRRTGTLRCFYQHTINDDPFERIGRQDMTASVDFTLLMDVGEQVGLRTIEFKRQREFLVEQGLLDRLMEMSRQESHGIDQLKSLLAAKRFVMPGALGDHFKLLIQRKRCGPC